MSIVLSHSLLDDFKLIVCVCSQQYLFISPVIPLRTRKDVDTCCFVALFPHSNRCILPTNTWPRPRNRELHVGLLFGYSFAWIRDIGCGWPQANDSIIGRREECWGHFSVYVRMKRLVGDGKHDMENYMCASNVSAMPPFLHQLFELKITFSCALIRATNYIQRLNPYEISKKRLCSHWKTSSAKERNLVEVFTPNAAIMITTPIGSR